MGLRTAGLCLLVVSACTSGATTVEGVGPTADPVIPETWEPLPAPPSDSDPPVEALRLTVGTPSGPFTLPLLDAMGLPVQATAAVAFDEDQDGAEELYLSNGTTRWRLDTDTLALVDPVDWLGPDGTPYTPDLLLSGTFAAEALLIGVVESEARVYDVDTQRFSEPFALPYQNPKSGLFTPTTLTVLHLVADNGSMLGIDDDGALVIDLNLLQFFEYAPMAEVCSSGEPIAASLVVALNDGRPGPFPESLIVVADETAFTGDEARCFDEGAPILDQDGQPVAPLFGVGVDFDGDGLDDLAWGHP